MSVALAVIGLVAFTAGALAIGWALGGVSQPAERLTDVASRAVDRKRDER